MELLLNLAWMLLALPAYWLWRQDAGVRAARRVSSLQCLLALGCALVLLFPVISASDDLHVMRAEMEESASKRTIKQAAGDKASAWTNRLQSPPAAVAGADWLPLPEIAAAEISDLDVPLVITRACAEYAGRAPPFSLLA
ncbi:MAG: hypothetical protein WA252_21495 [Candidatus Sulfotelmatobacter sp.]|jgi:hypothetical protein